MYIHVVIVYSTGYVCFVILYNTDFTVTLAHITYLVHNITLYLILFRVTLGNSCYHTFHAQGFVMNMSL